VASRLRSCAVAGRRRPALHWLIKLGSGKIMSATIAGTGVDVVTPPKSRIASIDLIRGAVMILMAIDHVRVYSGVPPGALRLESSSPAG